MTLNVSKELFNAIWCENLFCGSNNVPPPGVWRHLAEVISCVQFPGSPRWLSKMHDHHIYSSQPGIRSLSSSIMGSVGTFPYLVVITMPTSLPDGTWPFDVTMYLFWKKIVCFREWGTGVLTLFALTSKCQMLVKRC